MGKKKKLGSYPSVSVVGSMILALVVLGAFDLFLLVSKNLTRLVQENIQVQVYLQKEISESQRVRIEKTLGDKSFILKKEGTPVIAYISKEEAAKKFIEETGEDFYEFLGENPLRDSYLVNVDYANNPELNLEAVAKEIQEINGVFEVDYVESMINSINKNITRISLFLVVFALILLLVVIVLINNTIKLALFSQRFLIRSMQLVGARPSFIRRPFLLRSILQGAGAGTFAAALLVALLKYGTTVFPDLSALYDTNSLILLVVSLLVTGAIVGYLGTYLAISRYLKMSLDELY